MPVTTFIRPVACDDGGGSAIVYTTGSGSLTIVNDLKGSGINSIQSLKNAFTEEVISLLTYGNVDFQTVVKNALDRAITNANEIYDEMAADCEEMKDIDSAINGSTKVPWMTPGNGGR